MNKIWSKIKKLGPELNCLKILRRTLGPSPFLDCYWYRCIWLQISKMFWMHKKITLKASHLRCCLLNVNQILFVNVISKQLSLSWNSSFIDEPLQKSICSMQVYGWGNWLVAKIPQSLYFGDIHVCHLSTIFRASLSLWDWYLNVCILYK